jgi:hypothetical protein
MHNELVVVAKIYIKKNYVKACGMWADQAGGYVILHPQRA